MKQETIDKNIPGNYDNDFLLIHKNCGQIISLLYKNMKINGGIKSVFIAFAVFIFFISGSAHAQSFKAGVSVRIITPDPLLPVSGGIGTPKPAKEKKGELYARALVFEKGDTRIAIVSVDNLGWPAVLGDKSRALIKVIPPENILIGATHTHSAPDAYGFPDEKGNSSVDLKYLDWCVPVSYTHLTLPTNREV